MIKYFLTIALIALIGCENLEVVDTETLQKDSSNVIPKEGLVFHGLVENYDVVKGIWYDATEEKNNFSVVYDKFPPIKFVNNQIINQMLSPEAQEAVADCPTNLKNPFIFSYKNSRFQLNSSPATANNNNVTFIIVVKPLKLYENDEKPNFLITLNDYNEQLNEDFTCLRLPHKTIVMQQRAKINNDDPDWGTLDTRYGTNYSNTLADNSIQILTGRVNQNKVEAFKNGNLIASHEKTLTGSYDANTTYISGVRFKYLPEANTTFEGLIFEVLIYNEALNDTQLNEINQYLNDKYLK